MRRSLAALFAVFLGALLGSALHPQPAVAGAFAPAPRMPAGLIVAFGNSTAPSGWQLCDGSAVSRTTYSTLFTSIGTTWGAGDGSTTFNLPDLRGRAPIGQGTGSGLTARTIAGLVGVENVTLTAAQSGLPAHSHPWDRFDSTGTPSTQVFSSAAFGAWGVTQSPGTAYAGAPVAAASASQAHENMQPSLVVNFIIKE